nr:hypothetical protein [Tanacetum cinerariifolium]
VRARGCRHHRGRRAALRQERRRADHIAVFLRRVPDSADLQRGADQHRHQLPRTSTSRSAAATRRAGVPADPGPAGRGAVRRATHRQGHEPDGLSVHRRAAVPGGVPDPALDRRHPFHRLQRPCAFGLFAHDVAGDSGDGVFLQPLADHFRVRGRSKASVRRAGRAAQFADPLSRSRFDGRHEPVDPVVSGQPLQQPDHCVRRAVDRVRGDYQIVPGALHRCQRRFERPGGEERASSVAAHTGSPDGSVHAGGLLASGNA